MNFSYSVFDSATTDENTFCERFIRFINKQCNNQIIQEFKTTIRIRYSFDFGVITASGRKLPRQFSKINKPEFGIVRSYLHLSNIKFKINKLPLFTALNAECKARLDELQPVMPVKNPAAVLHINEWASKTNRILTNIDSNGLTFLKLIEPGLFAPQR